MNIQRILSGLLLLLTLFSCSKEKTYEGTSTLSIVHAVVGSEPLITSFNGTSLIGYYITAMRINYGAFNSLNNWFTAYTGPQDLALYQYPSDTTDASNPLMRLQLDLPVNSISTLFLTGTVAKPDTLMIRENIPYYEATDSVMGLRFLNLSPGSGPISVNIAGKAPGSAAGPLGFKEMTGFERFVVGAGIADYIFEFRDASGALVTTFKTLGISSPGSTYAGNAWLRKNYTVALIGIPGGTGANAQKVAQIPHSK